MRSKSFMASGVSAPRSARKRTISPRAILHKVPFSTTLPFACSSPKIQVTAGTAGGISPEAELFDTVIAQRAAYHDVAEEILTQLHPHLPSAWFPGDGALLDLARRYSQGAKHPIRFGGIVTGERFVTGERRTRLCQKFGALAADMETAAIAHVCFVRRVPFLSVRTISDTLEADGAESFAANCARASEIAAEVVSDLAELFSGAAEQPARRTGR